MRGALLVVVVCASVACQSRAPAPATEAPRDAVTAVPVPVPTAYARLGDAIRALPADGDVASLRPAVPDGVALATDGDGFSLTPGAPIDAAMLATAWQWPRAYAISTDVHQTRWWLVLYEADVADPYNQRIATTSPRLGAWTVRAELTGRPGGPLPPLVAGASPAYEIGAAPASVARITFAPAPGP